MNQVNPRHVHSGVFAGDGLNGLLPQSRMGPARPLWYKDDSIIVGVQWCFACIAKQVELL